MLMLRLNRIVIALIILWLASAVSFLFLSKCKFSAKFPYLEQSQSYFSNGWGPTISELGKSESLVETIKCVINGESTIDCLKKGSAVFFPFSFLQNYFEVYGRFETHSNEEKFFMSHSYSKVYVPQEPYSSVGPFMNFYSFNVESRDRVKCISARYGVPVSTQWSPEGYYYPIQISQFGLSHYSKLLTESPAEKQVVEDAHNCLGKWKLKDGRASEVQRVHDESLKSNTLLFQNYDSGIHLPIDRSDKIVLLAKLKLEALSTLEVTIQDNNYHETYTLVYAGDDTVLEVKDKKIIHGVGTNKWVEIVRYLNVDLKKGYAAMKLKRKTTYSNLKIVKISLFGEGAVDYVKLATSAHEELFLVAAQWLLDNQDQEGKWKINVKRKLIKNILELESGWCSAMGQGQAMSLLVRAYKHTGDKKFRDAAIKGLHPFKVNSSDNGVRAHFLDRYPWYEEYPTTPATFVLNGFMFSLLGLYDVYNTTESQEAKFLFYEGLNTLRQILPLYDTGSGTLYDMRHINLNVPPNLARWDYHSTHINQLYILATIDEDPLFKTAANRWSNYMKGHRASHN